MIEVRSISKKFAGKPVLDNVSVTFEQGKTNLVIGGSGSGKTVLMKCMVGLFEPDTGAIFYDNRNFSEMDPSGRKPVRQEIGMVFQGGALFDSMNVEENIMFPLSMFTAMSEEEKRDRANFCLNRVNLQNVNQRSTAELSGGMKKRVAIARAIALNPKYLFCDEPNSGLDPQTSIVIDNLILEITQEYNITTVINTHDMNSVMEAGDKIIFIHQGKKWWEGSASELMRAGNAELEAFIFASKLMKQLRSQK